MIEKRNYVGLSSDSVPTKYLLLYVLTWKCVGYYLQIVRLINLSLKRVSFACLFSGYGGVGGGTGVGLLAAGTVIAPLAALIAPLAALALLGSATLVAINPTLVQLAVIGRKKRDTSRLGFVKGWDRFKLFFVKRKGPHNSPIYNECQTQSAKVLTLL